MYADDDCASFPLLFTQVISSPIELLIHANALFVLVAGDKAVRFAPDTEVAICTELSILKVKFARVEDHSAHAQCV